MIIFDRLMDLLGDEAFWSKVPDRIYLTEDFEVREALKTIDISGKLPTFGWTLTEEYPHCWTTKVVSKETGAIFDVYLYFYPIQPTSEGNSIFGRPTEGLRIYAKKELNTNPYFIEENLVCTGRFVAMVD